MMKIASYRQSLCVPVPGDDILLITLQVTKKLPLRDVVDSGASNNAVHRQSLKGRRLKIFEAAFL